MHTHAFHTYTCYRKSVMQAISVERSKVNMNFRKVRFGAILSIGTVTFMNMILGGQIQYQYLDPNSVYGERQNDVKTKVNPWVTLNNNSLVNQNASLVTESRNSTKNVRNVDFPPDPRFEAPTRSSQPWAALCAIARWEQEYVDEWVDYHLGLGFRFIYIYDNDPDNVLMEWGQQKQGVQVIPFKPFHILKDTQQLSYTNCIQSLKKLQYPPRWVMFLDIDEFLVLKQNYTKLNNFLTDHLSEGALQINWLVFGTANERFYRSEPVTKRFQFRLKGINPSTKTIAVLEHIQSMKIHVPLAMTPGHDHRVGMGGRPVVVHGKGSHCCVFNGDTSVAVIHHYKFKSEQEFMQRKCKKLEKGGNYAHQKCSLNATPGTVFDDRAWKVLRSNVPKYAALYP